MKFRDKFYLIRRLSTIVYIVSLVRLAWNNHKKHIANNTKHFPSYPSHRPWFNSHITCFSFSSHSIESVQFSTNIFPGLRLLVLMRLWWWRWWLLVVRWWKLQFTLFYEFEIYSTMRKKEKKGVKKYKLKLKWIFFMIKIFLFLSSPT
jgi:hypothetical protein